MIHDDTLGPQTIQIPLSFTGIGDNIIIPGLFGKTTKVLQMFFVLNVASNLLYKSGSTPLTGTMFFLASGSYFQDFIDLQLQCNLGDDFIINSTSGAGGGTIWYIQS
jgi:hypothetical protein